MTQQSYRGRFAPSPTGQLHFGSLIAALASYLDARANQGAWLVRMEDLDRPREMPGAADTILRTLDAFGLHWDEEVIYQSQRDEAYQASLDSLIRNEVAYPCSCTRSDIIQVARIGLEGPIYPGTCRKGLAAGKKARAWRVLAPDRLISFNDLIQGPQQQNLALDIGDFVIRRADQLFAYQLAVVVDDAEQRITHVLRGTDLLLSTARQIYLQQLLGLATPTYAHIPVAVNARQEKLSKQTHAPAITLEQPGRLLRAALAFLNQPFPDDLANSRSDEILEFAIANWHPEAIPQQLKIAAPLHATTPLE